MKYIYSKVDPKKILHIIHRVDDFEKRKDLLDSREFLQVASIKENQEKSFAPHHHLWKDTNFQKFIAQESWVVIKGKVKVDFYDTDHSFICAEVLDAGDTSITLMGGHGYTILENDTLVYEYKTGPYFGQDLDKRFIETDND